jgi:D-ribose pyranose/furanose isomerase RbsD
LLNGISDDKLDISPKCIKFLDEHGLRMRDALKQLGEYEEEEEEQEDVAMEPVKEQSLVEEIKQKVQSGEKTEYSNSAMEDID